MTAVRRRLDPGLVDRAEESARQSSDAEDAQLTRTGIRQIQAADGDWSALPEDSPGHRTGRFLDALDRSSVGSREVRTHQNLDVSPERATDALVNLYRSHYRSLVTLAALLLDDTTSCEDVVQEAFIRVHSGNRRTRDPEKVLTQLRQTVVNLSRSVLRRRLLGLKLLSKPMPDMASAEEGAYDQLERDSLIRAMKSLQRRQREVLVLCYFVDMTEAQVAETLGISLGAVKAYRSRGIASLRVAMESPA
ncbi:SigE family RNA polymerase sigma factor [Streptomyces sp. NBC_00075]|uniref:SigE family RNA polymerase sigma factor n=1 Tax=Streptomyces sp. NBC_00075 TaxID=2975641 RepID=UPI00386CC3EE